MNLRTPRRRTFSRGMLSAFHVHSSRYFLDWMEDFNRKSDIERIQQDLERVGKDMSKTLNEQADQSIVVG